MPERRTGTGSEHEGAGRRISQPSLVLIADDEVPIAQIIGDLVRELDATPLLTTHGREALTLARRHRPALVIIDLMMPLLPYGAKRRTQIAPSVAER